MTISTNETLLDAVAEIGPVVREHAAEAEAGAGWRRGVRAMRFAGFPHAAAALAGRPRGRPGDVRAGDRGRRAPRLGGGLGPAGGQHRRLVGARVPDEGVEEIWGPDPDTMIAAAFHAAVPGVADEAATGSPAGGRSRALFTTRTGCS